ncbi:MAG: argininosuccinate lyase [Bacteroidales bacterium]|nr:argininosuccinate lyase [Bacteroidales bacterium]MCD8394263.1 argininosuccinate lyase [Bacteroidales bacterium]
MANKLWEKDFSVDRDVETYTVGRDREMDIYLAPYDVLGSLAHITMLQSVGLLQKDELEALSRELRDIYAIAERGDLLIEPGVEDIHSQVELELTRRLGDIGKKIHSGRSRNDQVLVDLKLFIRSRIEGLTKAMNALFDALQSQSERYKDVIIPGYTHLQVAMPSSIGMWLGAYAESLVDDLIVLRGAYDVANRNPLGSAAGYGSSFPLDRDMTTRLLGFASMDYNAVYAQMGRGKTERIVAQAIASVAATVAKLAMDACLYNSQNFGFIRLPKEYTTGSSIMPHKKNPDVFELTRARCNKLQALPYEITLITNNLPSGYFRDLQLIKENFLPAFDEIETILAMVTTMVQKMEVNPEAGRDPRYELMYSVEKVNDLVKQGVPFRDAYKQVGLEIEHGQFQAPHELHHTHAGSLGNLCNDRVAQLWHTVLSQFDFATYHRALDSLLGRQ